MNVSMKVVLFDLRTDGHHLKHVYYLARYLLEAGHEVAFVTWARNPRVDSLAQKLPMLHVRFVTSRCKDDDRIGVIRLLWRSWLGIGGCLRFAAEWHTGALCFMYLDYSELPLLLRFWMWRGPRWPSIGYLIWAYSARSADAVSVIFFRKAYRSLRRWALGHMLRRGFLKAVLVDSQWAKESLLGRKLELPMRVIISPSPCEELAYTVPMDDARRRLSLPTDMCLLLFFGRLRRDKGPDLLLQALDGIGSSVGVVFAGQEGYVTAKEVEEAARNASQRHLVIPRVRYISEADEALYFLAVDAVLLPYRRVFRGVSGVLHNAAAAGRPVIAADVGEIGELVRRYSLGLVVEPESPEALREAIITFVKNRGELTAMAKASSTRYVADHHCRKMGQLVEVVLGDDRQQRPGQHP